MSWIDIVCLWLGRCLLFLCLFWGCVHLLGALLLRLLNHFDAWDAFIQWCLANFKSRWRD